MSEKHKVRNVLINIIILLALAMIIYMIASAVVNADNDSEDTTIFGLKIIHIETDSMEPEIKTDAWVIGYKKPFEQLQPGDYISFIRESDLELVTHQVSNVSTSPAFVETISVNYQAPDGQKITNSTYRYYVPKWLVFNFAADLYTTKGRLIYGGIAAGIIVLVIVLVSILRARKRRKPYNIRNISELSQAKKVVRAESAQPESIAVPALRDWRDEIFDGVDL